MGVTGHRLSYAKYARPRLQTVQSTLALGDFVRFRSSRTQPGVDAPGAAALNARKRLRRLMKGGYVLALAAP